MVFSCRVKLIFAVLACFCTCEVFAMPCSIVGSASGAAGSVISISIDADPLSKERTLLSTVEVDANEQFRLEFDLTETRL